MDLSIEYSLPIALGRPVAYYRDTLGEFKEQKTRWGHMLSGTIALGGQARTVHLEVDDDIVRRLSLPLQAGDTFAGISMACTPIKFQKDLHKIGVQSNIELDSLTLPDQRVAFTIYEDELYIVDWHEPAAVSRVPLS